MLFLIGQAKPHTNHKMFLLFVKCSVLSMVLTFFAHAKPHIDIPVQATNLLVEGVQTPLNVHNLAPRLSWHANVKEQAAYQIQVASSPDKLLSGKIDLWDTGKVTARRSLNVEYQGAALRTNQVAYWRVRVWAQNEDQAKTWSQIERWEMGLLNKSDWHAKWLQVEQPVVAKLTNPVKQWINHAGSIVNKSGKRSAPALNKLQQQPTASLFRHDFSVNKTIVKAKLHSTAGGYYEIYINGQKVGNRFMDPGQTDFEKRILYNTDDVAALLDPGKNTLAVHLASGWYNENIAFSLWNNPDKKPNEKNKKSLSYGQPKFIAQLEIEYSDGSTKRVSSDQTWLTHPSPILKEGIFSGELFDANKQLTNWNRKNANVTDWAPVKVLENWPTQALVPQRLPPIRKQRLVKPVNLLNPAPGVWVWDFGQNFTGMPTLKIKNLALRPNQSIFLRYAEWINKQGHISQLSGGGGATHLNAVDGYISGFNNLNNWSPKFTWRGFRYVEIRGLTNAPKLTDLTANLLRSDVVQAGQFESSNPLINRIHQTALWTYESNLMSVPLDCPIREKAGWTGDAHAAMITGNYNFDMQTFWRKYLGDFKTARFLAPAVVPGKRTVSEKVDWAAAEVMIAWQHYQHHGDKQVLLKQYNSLLEYMAFGQSQLTDYLTSNGFGDWCDPVKHPGMPRVGGRGVSQYTSTTVTSSALFAHAANLMSKIATVVNNKQDAIKFAALFKNIRNSFHQALYNPISKDYGSQTANAMAIRFDIAPGHLKQSVADALHKDVSITHHGHSSVGALGQTWLYRALSDYGYADTAYGIFTAKGYPGFSYLFNDLDGTTLWERKGQFDPNAGHGPVNSLNHPFHSGYDGWFYEGLGGIRPLENSVGFQDFELKPVFPKQLNQAKVSYVSGYGKIKSTWQRTTNGKIKWQFTVPNNTRALVHTPSKKPKIYLAGSYELVF